MVSATVKTIMEPRKAPAVVAVVRRPLIRGVEAVEDQFVPE